MLTRRRSLVALAFLTFIVTAPPRLSRLSAADQLPAKLTDREFWSLSGALSEPDGFFRSDNFLSNERGYQTVIPDLVARIKPGGVYMGVGPEQNFSYIVALKPRMAFIIDIRRGNLHEHLLYKALIEMSADRADFLSRLFSRQRPAGLSTTSSAQEFFKAYDAAEPSEELFKQNLGEVIERLTKKHQFALSDDDVRGIGYVYHDAFFAGGPNLVYSMGRGGGGLNSPTYEELMLSDDGQGQNRGYLATEENFRFLKTLETDNLLVPVVGDFAGPKAIRAVGGYVKEHAGTVVAFYLSNVEQFLAQGGIWGNFCSSVATLPLDETSTFIFSGRGNPYRPGSNGFGFARGLQTAIRPMVNDVRQCPDGGR